MKESDRDERLLAERPENLAERREEREAREAREEREELETEEREEREELEAESFESKTLFETFRTPKVCKPSSDFGGSIQTL